MESTLLLVPTVVFFIALGIYLLAKSQPAVVEVARWVAGIAAIVIGVLLLIPGL